MALWVWLDRAAQAASVAGGAALVAGVVTYAQSERNEWSKSYNVLKGLRDKAIVEIARPTTTTTESSTITTSLSAYAPSTHTLTAAPSSGNAAPSSSNAAPSSPLSSSGNAAPSSGNGAAPASARQSAAPHFGLELAAWLTANCATEALRTRAARGSPTDDRVVATCQLIHDIRAAGRDLLQRRNTRVARATELFVDTLGLASDQARFRNELRNVLETVSPLDAANWRMRIARDGDDLRKLPLDRPGNALAINVLAKDRVVYETYLVAGLFEPKGLASLDADVRGALVAATGKDGSKRAARLLEAFISDFDRAHNSLRWWPQVRFGPPAL